MKTVIHADSLKWLSKTNNTYSFVTGIPDMDEVNLPLDEYIKFYEKTAKLIFSRLDKEKGYAIFIQTDRKINRSWFDKSYHLTKVAFECGLRLLFHKIVLDRGVGKINLHRPTYKHLVCYCWNPQLGPGAASTDVLDVSSKIYSNSTPLLAAQYAVGFMKKNAPDLILCDPFCGRGTIINCARDIGLQSIGIDIDPKQVQISQNN